jgi:endoglucanase
MGGCSEDDIYLGWLNVSSQKIGYTPPVGSYIQLTSYTSDTTSISGRVALMPIPSTNSNFPLNGRDVDGWYTGINLSGLEFSTMPNASVIPDISTGGVDESATADFMKLGANTVRLPVRWEYMQPYGADSVIDEAVFKEYFNNLVAPTLTILTSHNYNVVLDLHSYMHYSVVGRDPAGCAGDGKCPAGMLVIDPSKYVNIWNRMFNQMKTLQIDTSRIMIDLVNEPTSRDDEPLLTAQQVFDMEVAVIKSLKGLGFNGKFLVEGVSWSGLHSWDAAGNSQVFTRANFLNAGIDAVTIDNQIVINVHQYLDSNYSGTHEECMVDLTTTGATGFNLDAFTAYLKNNNFKAIVTEFGAGNDQATCSIALNSFMQYLQQNKYSQDRGYGFVGWTAWSTGHGWGTYNLRIKPDDWKAAIISNYFNK